MKAALLALCLFSFLAVQSQELRPAEVGGRFGFARNGQLVIPASYEYAVDFHHGLALVKQNGKWGYIDPAGKNVVPCIYDQATSPKGGVAKVWQGKKTGLVDSLGRFIVEPAEQQIDLDSRGIYITRREGNDTVMGYISNENQQLIPIEYKSIETSYDYSYGVRHSGEVDLYYKGKLFLEGLAKVPGYYETFYPDGTMLVEKEDKYGIISTQGELLLPIEYNSYERLETQSYNYGDKQLQIAYVIVMDKAEWFYSPEMNGRMRLGEPQLIIVTPDGKPAMETVFSDLSYVTLDDGTMQLQGKADEKIVIIDLPSKLTFTEYRRFDNGIGYKIGHKEGSAEIIAVDTGEKLAEFDFAETPRENYTLIDPESGMSVEMRDQPINEPYAWVARINGNDTLWALYSVPHRRLLSDWDQVKKPHATYTYFGSPNNLVELYYGGKSAYYLNGMEKPTAYEFETVGVVAYQFLVTSKLDEELMSVYAFKNGSLEFLTKTASIDLADNIRQQQYYVGDNAPDGAYYESSRFSSYFFYLTDENNKISVMLPDFTILPLKADTLIQSSSTQIRSVLEYRKNGKWGLIDLRDGRYSPADRPESGQFNYAPDFDTYYRLAEDESHYIDMYNRKFYSMEAYPFKKGNKTGLITYNEFSETDNNKVEMIPPIYKKIEETSAPGRMLAQNGKGKWGVLSFFGDTIVPFEYDDITDTDIMWNDYNEWTHQYYKTRIGKKYGLRPLDANFGLPAVYDQIYMGDFIFLEREGKLSLVEYPNLIPKVTGEFDALASFVDYSDDVLYLQRNDKWYMLNIGGDGNNYDITQMQRGADLIINGTEYWKKDGSFYRAGYGTDQWEKIENPVADAGCSQMEMVDGKIRIVDAKGKPMYKELLTIVQCDSENPTYVQTIIGNQIVEYNLTKKAVRTFKYPQY